tara:strand:+ start:161 stop:661 length:501 start_codon:yes stop_codon:yes gene_type:complete
MKIKTFAIKLLFCFFLSASLNAEERTSGLKFYTGTFDFSDEGAKSQLFGVQHQDGNLFRDTFLGEVSPITGAMVTADNAVYLYSGIEANYSMGIINITPSFAPGYYNKGDGKDLGHGLEFKSEVQLSFDLGDTTNFGMSYNHVSNASLGDKNPGANSYTFNFLKKF